MCTLSVCKRERAQNAVSGCLRLGGVLHFREPGALVYVLPEGHRSTESSPPLGDPLPITPPPNKILYVRFLLGRLSCSSSLPEVCEYWDHEFEFRSDL
jgi:hypothetical protein